MRFRDISISWKLTLLAVVTTLLSMATVIFTVSLIDRQLAQLAMVEGYVTLADVLGQSCLDSLQNSDHNRSLQSLTSLRKDHEVVMACLFDESAQVFAQFNHQETELPELDWAKRMNGTFTRDGFLHITRPIQHNKSAAGHLYLRISDEKLASRWWDQMIVAACMCVLSLVMAVGLAMRLQQLISGPVLHLVDTADHIARSGDFTIRAEHETGDELGELGDRFNQMLDTIEARDAELERHQQNLEKLVQERTNELEKRTQEAMAASVAKSAFLANMSHEIRTPMNAIIGFADMLRKGHYDSENERIEFLNTICASGKHLLGLISDILDLSKIEAGCMTTEIIPVSPHQLISDVVSIMRVNALSKGLALDYNWNGPVPRQIMTDPAKMRQLLINLIGNSTKFTERGGVHVLARLSSDQKNLQMQVIDTGIGIPSDKLNTIFTPFSQADSSVTRRFGGTGLGLSISRRIAEALGGSLIVESEPGVGSTFTATVDIGDAGQLDLQDTAPVSDLIPRSERENEDATPSIPVGSKILLVEDGDTNRRLIHKMLERHGIEVMDAVNGKIGVDLATAHEFDVILMDMQMPVMDGYTAATILRAKGLTIPIVALTAHAMAGDSDKCRNAGCSDYLTKPIQESRLLSKIAELLNRHAAGKLTDQNQTRTPVTSAHPEISGGLDQPNNTTIKQAEVTVKCSLPMDDEVFREIVQEFSDKLQTQVERMKLAYSSEDWKELVELAHWLKGSGGTAGYEQFTIPSGRLERLAAQQCTDKIETVLNEIDGLARAVAAEMDSLPVLAV